MKDCFKPEAIVLPGEAVVVRSDDIQEFNVPAPGVPDRVIQTAGGLAILAENTVGGKDKATVGWHTYGAMLPISSGRAVHIIRRNGAAEAIYAPQRVRTRKKDEDIPAFYIAGGGPSTPAIAHAALLYGGPWQLPHKTDGLVSPDAEPIPSSEWFRGGDVTFYDPCRTGVTEPLDPTDSNWHMGTRRDGLAFAGLVRWHLENIADKKTAPILVASSFGATRNVAAGIHLSKWGVEIPAMVFLSGLCGMDRVMYGDGSESHEAYIGALPSIIMSNRYHTEYGKDYEANSATYEFKEQELAAFNDAVAFSNGLYRQLITGKLNENDDPEGYKDAVSQMSQLTGVSQDTLQEVGYKLSPSFYAGHRFKEDALRLSTLDGRRLYDASLDFRIDPHLDTLEPAFLHSITSADDAMGVPDIFRTPEYKGISLERMRGDWPTEGIWQEADLMDMLGEFWKRSPKTRIVAFIGFYDLNCCPGTAINFWQRAQEELGADVVYHGASAEVYNPPQNSS